jgi:FkbM family methyltransferase
MEAPRGSSAPLASRIAAHVVHFEEMLERVRLCASDSRSCPDWWREVEHSWQRNASTALAARLERHAQQHGDFLPESGPSTFRALMLAVWRERRPWPILEYWKPELTCGTAHQRTATNGSSDGGKWLCGSQPLDFVRPCRVLSVGSNFEDDFERAMHRIAGCRSLVFDPTLGPESSERVRRFAASLAQYGSKLNASVGLGVGKIVDRTGTRHQLRPLAELLAGSAGFFVRDAAESEERPRAPHHLTVAKIDAEGGEFGGGLLGPNGLWELCATGQLTVDQVSVEVHLRSAGSLSALNAIFEGAARCGMMLLHKETNWLGCHLGGCVEFSWASLRHVRRVLGHARQRMAVLAQVEHTVQDSAAEVPSHNHAVLHVRNPAALSWCPHNVGSVMSNLRRAQTPSLVLDVGAFDGSDAIRYAQTGHIVWSFEPSPAKLEPIRDRVRSAGLAEKITVFGVALSDANGTTPFHVHMAPKASGRRFFRGGLGSAQDSVNAAAPAGSRGQVVTVEKRRLDDVVPPGMEVLLVKIDAQGHEPRVLQGASRLLAAHRIKVIAAEWAPAFMQGGANEAVQLVEMLHGFGYECTACAESQAAKPVFHESRMTNRISASMYARRLAAANSTLGDWDNLVCKPRTST